MECHLFCSSESSSPFLETSLERRRQWHPTPVFLPGESQGQGSLVGCCLWGCTGLDTTEVTQQQQQQCGQRSRNRMTNADDNSVLTISKIQHIILTFKVAVITCLVAKSCPTLCDPMDSSPPGSSVHGIIQARILECIAISFSRGCFPPRG